MCAQTVWHLVYALGASAHPFHPSKEACHRASSLPQVASLELTCYLSASCAWSFPMTAQGAPSVESHTHTHTHTTNTHASLARQWNRTGGWAGDTSPEPQWCPSFSCSLLFSTNTHIQTATFIHKHWPMLTGWLLLSTTAMVGLREYYCF